MSYNEMYNQYEVNEDRSDEGVTDHDEAQPLQSEALKLFEQTTKASTLASAIPVFEIIFGEMSLPAAHRPQESGPESVPGESCRYDVHEARVPVETREAQIDKAMLMPNEQQQRERIKKIEQALVNALFGKAQTELLEKLTGKDVNPEMIRKMIQGGLTGILDEAAERIAKNINDPELKRDVLDAIDLLKALEKNGNGLCITMNDGALELAIKVGETGQAVSLRTVMAVIEAEAKTELGLTKAKSDLIKHVADGFKNAGEDYVEGLRKLLKSPVDAFKIHAETQQQVLNDIVQAAQNGLRKAGTNVQDTVKNVAQTVDDAAGDIQRKKEALEEQARRKIDEAKQEFDDQKRKLQNRANNARNRVNRNIPKWLK